MTILTNPTNGLEGARVRSSHRTAPAKPPTGIMLLNLDRTAYAGLFSNVSRRIQGCLDVYVALDRPFRISIEGGAFEHAALAVVPAFAAHHIDMDDRMIGIVQLESETIDSARLPAFLRGAGAVDRPDLAERMRDRFARLRRADSAIDPRTVDIDTFFFGAPVARRRLDPRVTVVAERIRRRPCDPLDAESCAQLAGLSPSRFLRLFRAELGTTFRRFRAWKRVRSMLPHVSRRPNLSDFALELGYSDATHFSHSIRNFMGLTPRDIFAGSRRLAVVLQSGEAPLPQHAA